MAKSQTAYRPARERSRWLLGLMLGGLGLVFLRLVQVQVLEHDYFLTEIAPLIGPGQTAQQSPQPGSLLCRTGEPLAESVMLFHVLADPKRMLENRVDFGKAASELSPIIRRPATAIYADLDSHRRTGYAVLSRWVGQETARAVRDLNTRGLDARPAWRRQYPMGKVACHLVGGRDRFHRALGGLEHQYRLLLDGQADGAAGAGQTQGMMGLDGASTVGPAPGRDVVLTIDPNLQRQVETEMDRLWAQETPRRASCTIMDPRNGEILAMSARPAYDPNDYVTGEPAPGCRWSPVPASATVNWPVAAAVEQGSTFKILLVAAALSSGKVPSSRRFVCRGHLDLGGPPISCWGKYGAKGHGSLDMAGMLANSCNICAAQTALALGAEGYHDFLVRCGINQDPQAGFPGEAFGYLAGPSRLRRRDLASMGFGQNVSCSALQLTSIVAGLVNGGVMMQPHIVGAAVNKDGSLFGQVAPTRERTLCSPEVSRELRSMLEGVVVNGTGKAAQIPGVRVGGKTGTAQQWDPVLKRHRSDRYLVSFIAVFPIEQPRYVIHVACDEPHHGQHGADVAAPVCQRLGKFILQQVDRTPPATPRRVQTPKPQPARPEAGSPPAKLAAAPGAARVGGL